METGNIKRKVNCKTTRLHGRQYLLYLQTNAAARMEHPGTNEWLAENSIIGVRNAVKTDYGRSRILLEITRKDSERTETMEIDLKDKSITWEKD